MSIKERTAIVIGAGPGGLASAILLASSGVKVKLFERLPMIGGRTSTIEANGFKFDLGPTFFLYPRVLDEIFHVAGTSLRAEIEMVRLDPQYRLIFGAGGELNCTPNLDRMVQEIAKIAPGDAEGFRRFITENRTKLSLMEPTLEQPFLSFKDLLSLSLLKVLPYLRPHQSLDDYLKRFFKDQRIRLALAFQSKYLGMSPFRCPSLFSILSFLEYEYGVWHPIGGCGAVTKAMARVAERLGVEIRLGEPVEEILFAGKRAVGVRTAEMNHHADAVVLNGDFARVIQKLVPNRLRRRWSDANIAKKQFSCSTFMIYAGIDGRYDLPHHNIYISSSYEQNLRDIEDGHVLSDDPSFYVQNASVTDSTLAPRGQSALYILSPVTHQHENVNWAKEKESFRERLLAQVAKAGFTDLESRIRYERVVTPADWDSRYEIHLGATFNLAHSLPQMLHRRPKNRFDDVDGLYLVGGGTHPGSGLPVIFESARISSRLLLNDLNIRADWTEAPRRANAFTAEPQLAAS
jgi:phytoene desaturase